MKRIVGSTLELSAILSVFLIGQVPLKIGVENFVFATMENRKSFTEVFRGERCQNAQKQNIIKTY